MPWIPIEGALRRWRESLRMTVPELVKATRGGVKESTIRQWEGKKCPKTAQDGTVRALASALANKSLGLECLPEFLAWFRRSDGVIEPSTAIDPTLYGQAPPQPPDDLSDTVKVPKRKAQAAGSGTKRKALTKRDVSASAVGDDQQLVRAFTRNAAIERALQRHEDRVTLASGAYPLVGLGLLQELESLYKEHEGKRYAVAGVVKEHKALASKMADELQAEAGRGAAYSLIVRTVAGRDEDGTDHKVQVYPTVYAPKGEHGKLLARCWSEQIPVTAVVRVITTTPRPGVGDDRFLGFFGLEPGRKRPRLWAFVVEEVVIADGSEESGPIKRRQSKNAPVFAPGKIRIR